MIDRLLVTRCRKGTRGALRRIYEKYRDSLLILAIALSQDVNLAEDAVHDVFVAFAQNVASFRLTGSLKAYLSKCVANRVRDLMRKKHSRAKALNVDAKNRKNHEKLPKPRRMNTKWAYFDHEEREGTWRGLEAATKLKD